MSETIEVNELDFDSAFDLIEAIRDSEEVSEMERSVLNNAHYIIQTVDENLEELHPEDY